jgi:RNA polymerase sigma-70 factor (ECF subfamily)
MKKTTLFAIMALGALCLLKAPCALAQSVESMAPVVVKTVPQAGSTDVEPGEMEVKITFSKEMMDESWSWSSAWQDSGAPFVGKPKYSADHKTCEVKVKLESGKTYGWWINSQRFTGFKDKQGRSAIPYLFVFRVK